MSNGFDYFDIQGSFRNARPDEAEKVYYVVQHTKAVIYPDYGVLVKDSEIIGTGSRTGNHITRVYVLPEYQGLGFGSMIMDELEKKIFKDYDYCELDASLPACVFYEKRGYKTVKHVKYDIGNGKCMIYEIMRKGNDSKRYQR